MAYRFDRGSRRRDSEVEDILPTWGDTDPRSRQLGNTNADGGLNYECYLHEAAVQRSLRSSHNENKIHPLTTRLFVSSISSVSGVSRPRLRLSASAPSFQFHEKLITESRRQTLLATDGLRTELADGGPSGINSSCK
ncbi:unnamed protein product [Pleuronectes platessa]|uniref:Uncharacterized protein n=1 Tax=Pleuronectes platessa TaxID=8262 RepID=A0A9N7UJF2_PLEPL|nr:unnamed protein product [Pleuronectes platessa]